LSLATQVNKKECKKTSKNFDPKNLPKTKTRILSLSPLLFSLCRKTFLLLSLATKIIKRECKKTIKSFDKKNCYKLKTKTRW
jgi:hypothetical protein